MYQGYGLTETSLVIASEDDKYRRLGSIGKAFPSLDVKLDNINEEGIENEGKRPNYNDWVTITMKKQQKKL